jgi:hypothetical protein
MLFDLAEVLSCGLRKVCIKGASDRSGTATVAVESDSMAKAGTKQKPEDLKTRRTGIR